MNSTTRRIAASITLIAAVMAVITILHRTGSRSALEHYKAELRAKGEKLTFKELAIAPSTNTAEVASRQFFAALSNQVFASNVFLAAGPIPKLMEYVAPGRARVTWRGDLRLDNGGPISGGDWANLDKQNQGAAEALAPVIIALQNPAPDTGWIYDDTYENALLGPPRTFARDRALAQGLVRAEIGALHRGEFELAITHIHALTGLSRLNRNEVTLVSEMTRVAIAGLALGGTWEALAAPGWDEPRLAALQRDWEQVEFLNGLERAFTGERIYFQSIMAKIRNSRGVQLAQIISPSSTRSSGASQGGFTLKNLWAGYLSPSFYRVTSISEDELFQLKFATALVEQARALKEGRPWPEVALAITNLYDGLIQSLTEDRFQRLQVSAMAIPNFTRAFPTVARTETQRRLTITAIAIKRYQLKHGSPPPTLAALTPEFLTEALVDSMSAKGFGYRLNPDGGFVLYSAGEDGKDDGGQGGTGLWLGLDAVWPSAADETTATVTKR